MCSDLGFRKHEPRNRRTLYPQAWQLLLMDSRSWDWNGGCENTLKRPFTIQMQAFIIIIISSLLAIISRSGDLFKCKFNHIVPFVQDLPLLSGQKPKLYQPSSPSMGWLLPTSQRLPLSLSAPTQAFSQTFQLPYSSQPQDLCMRLSFGTPVLPHLAPLIPFLFRCWCNHTSSRKLAPPFLTWWILPFYSLTESRIALLITLCLLSIYYVSDSILGAGNIMVKKESPRELSL